MRIRLNHIVAASLLFLGSFSHAIGLGEASVQSYFGAPLDLRIPVHHLGKLTGDDLRVALSALNDDVSGSPLDAMVGSKYQVEYDPESRSIHIRSDQAVMDPYLAFTLNVRWPRGFLQREYTVLLDFPAYQKTARPDQRVAAQAGPKTLPEETRQTSSTIANTPQTLTTSETSPTKPEALTTPANTRHTASTPRVAPQGNDFGDGEYRVVRGDSLWSIATRLSSIRTGDHSQWMAAVYESNPRAFIAGRPDILKEAYRLRIPEQCNDTRLVLNPDGRTFKLTGANERVAGQPSPEQRSPATDPSPESSNSGTAAATSPPTPDTPSYTAIESNSEPGLSPFELYSLSEQASGTQPETETNNYATSAVEIPAVTEPAADVSAVQALDLQAAQSRGRVEDLEKQLDQALALIEKQRLQSLANKPSGSLPLASDPALAEMSNPAYAFRALGWLALGMSMVMGFFMYRDRGGPRLRLIPRDRRRRDFATMLERNG